MTDWTALASAAMNEGREQAMKILGEHGEFISQFPKTALKLAISTMPGKRREPEYWSAMLREMGPEERESFRTMMKEDAAKAAEYTNSWISAGSLWLDALKGLGDVASAVIRTMLKQYGGEVLQQIVTPQPADQAKDPE